MSILAIARNTFLEARRDRVQWILVLYLGIVFGGTFILSPLSLGEGYRITRDLGLAGMSIVGVILIVLVGGGLVHREIERRTILTLLAKPVRRWEFLLGKYFGLLAMVSLVFVGMLVVFAASLLLQEGRVEPAVAAAALATFGEFVVVTALVVFFSTFATPALAGVFTLALVVFGHFAEDLLRFAEQAPGAALSLGARACYLFLPHLETFNLRPEAAYSVIPDPMRMVALAGYAALYAGMVLAVAAAAFSRREFR
jgi:ABC-type transport system involved in multi-copper enzyme maturation permease subunit